MASPQTGIFALGTNSHACLEFDLAAAAHTLEAVARIAALREAAPGAAFIATDHFAASIAAIAGDRRPERAEAGVADELRGHTEIVLRDFVSGSRRPRELVQGPHR